MIRALPLVLALAGCNLGAPSAGDFVGTGTEVTPGLASCATAIGRSDLIADPDAPMTTPEIEALLACTATRAQG